jgi:hypothetical protein
MSLERRGEKGRGERLVEEEITITPDTRFAILYPPMPGDPQA